jgi:hypothetical protein
VQEIGQKKYKLGCFVRKINTSTRRMACIYLGDEWMGCIKKKIQAKKGGKGKKIQAMTRNQKKKIQATIRTGVKREFCANQNIALASNSIF